MLLSYKADVNVKNATGDSCMSFAQKSGNQEIIMMLVQKGLSLRPQMSSQSTRPESSDGRKPKDARIRPASGKRVMPGLPPTPGQISQRQSQTQI